MPTVFLTGGSGFVGRNMIRLLREQGYAVRAAARSPQAEQAVRGAGAEPVLADLDAHAALEQGMRGCAFVVHAAARVEPWGTLEQFMRANVSGTENVLAAARAAGVPRFVHVSTEAVLVGGKPMVNADETWPRPPHAPGLYPYTKGLAEARVLAANSIQLATVIVRPRFIWGHGDTSLLPKLVAAVRAGQFAWIGGGHHLTSTCHVRNVCEGILLAAERGRGGEIYFLTDGAPIEFRSFITALCRTQGVDPGSRSIPRALARTLAPVVEGVWNMLRLPGDPPLSRTVYLLLGEEVTVNDAKARRELGYRERVTREQGLTEMVAPEVASDASVRAIAPQ
jgi:nucleoside-diphosphate-sugar epimerase